MYRDVGTNGVAAFAFYAADIGSAFGGNFGIGSAANTAAWALYTAAVSQSSTGKRFLAVVELNSYDSGVVKLAFRSIKVVYTPANTQATI
jgi:3-isopropylmalate dehydratase small subunit